MFLDSDTNTSILHTFFFKTNQKAISRIGEFKEVKNWGLCVYMYILDILSSGQKSKLHKKVCSLMWNKLCFQDITLTNLCECSVVENVMSYSLSLLLFRKQGCFFNCFQCGHFTKILSYQVFDLVRCGVFSHFLLNCVDSTVN